MVAEGDLGASETLGCVVEDAPSQPRAHAAVGLALGNALRDELVGVLAKDVMRIALIAQPSLERAAVVVEGGLRLLHLHGARGQNHGAGLRDRVRTITLTTLRFTLTVVAVLALIGMLLVVLVRDPESRGDGLRRRRVRAR